MTRRRHRRLPSSVHLPRRIPRSLPPVVLFILVVMVVLRDRDGPAPSPPQTVARRTTDADFERYHDRSFRVARVVDGDTIDLDVPDGDSPTMRVRLWGVDTPEIAHGDKPDMYFGPEAAAFARKTLEGRTVHVVLSPADTRGRYGRLLAYIFLERGGVMFNELLIERGYAYADTRFKHPYMDRFLQAERRARRARAGLWAGVTVEQMPAWRQRLER